MKKTFGCYENHISASRHIPHAKGLIFFEEPGSKHSFRDGYAGGEGRKHDAYKPYHYTRLWFTTHCHSAARLLA